MDIEETNISGVFLLKPEVYRDKRGFFLETYSEKIYSDLGISNKFVQDNFSHSKKNVLRGLHYQIKQQQGKLVRVTQGRVFDVAVDIRKNSPSFGKYYSAILDNKNCYQLFMPPGIAHGFCVLSDFVDFEYKCTDYYSPQNEQGVHWNDPDISIDWPIENPILSIQDENLPFLSNISKNLLPE
jgi:dTDP-4-dehydrorhamnose 3,5-epimerase